VREIAAAASVSPALVLHHFGSKEGLRAAVDEHAEAAFDAILDGLAGQDLGELISQGGSGSIAEAFARGFPPGSPLPDYLRRLLLAEDPAGSALFARWYAATTALLDAMVAAGAARRGGDQAVRAACFLVNDLALILLRRQIAAAIGIDPLSPEGITRWAAEVTTIYAEGAFDAPAPE
jgi:AcrR family transcriptional regulator